MTALSSTGSSQLLVAVTSRLGRTSLRQLRSDLLRGLCPLWHRAAIVNTP
ncbi:hypothetical protein [Roseibium sp.]